MITSTAITALTNTVAMTPTLSEWYILLEGHGEVVLISEGVLISKVS